MNQVEGLLGRLRSVAQQLAAEERPTFSPGASTDAIVGLQAILPAPLPNDFIDFLRACEAVIAVNVWNGYWIGGINQLARSVRRGDYPAMLSDEAREAAVFPIGTDGGGNAFLMSLQSGQIWKWDRETGNAQNVAATFAGLLERVAEDWEHFLSGDKSWHYLSG
jgi:SMI1 / KNR4 family (SUKH-1)